MAHEGFPIRQPDDGEVRVWREGAEEPLLREACHARHTSGAQNMDGLMKGSMHEKTSMALTPLSLKTPGGGRAGGVAYKDRPPVGEHPMLHPAVACCRPKIGQFAPKNASNTAFWGKELCNRSCKIPHCKVVVFSTELWETLWESTTGVWVTVSFAPPPQKAKRQSFCPKTAPQYGRWMCRRSVVSPEPGG